MNETPNKNPVVLPVIHLNGTDKESLIEQLSNVYEALQHTMDVLRQASPNGRDYYPDPGRMEKAEAQHRRRQEILANLAKEIEEEIQLIDNLNR